VRLLELEEEVDLNKLPKKPDVVLTGRTASKGLIERADFVNEVKDVKHPKEVPTTRGIQY
jgi:cob(I)alamin adenosyltransferase